MPRRYYLRTGHRRPAKKKKNRFEITEQEAPSFWMIRQVLTECDRRKKPKHKMVIMLGFFLGLRRNEMCGIKVKDFRFWSGEVYVRPETAKMGSGGYIQILSQKFTDEVQAYIKKNKLDDDDFILNRNGKPYSTKHMSHFAGEAFDWAAAFTGNIEFEDLYTHSLRHAYARWMEINRYPPKFIRAQLRHLQTSTSQDMYGHFNQSDMRRLAATGPSIEW